MTTLVLSVTRGPVDAVNQTRHVSSGEFEIGRAPPSDWVLSDPNCILSKRHCVFRQDERGWWVADVSRNGSFLSSGDRTFRLERQPHRVSVGDNLRLGAYEFAIDLLEDEPSFRAYPRDAAAGALPRMSRPRDVPPYQPRYGGAEDFWGQPAAPERPSRGPRPSSASSAGERQGLAALLEGALMSQDDVRAEGAEGDVLRAVGAALRSTVSELRRMRLAALGEPQETRSGTIGTDALPLAQARNEREALRWLLAEERKYDLPPEAVIEAAFAELRHHHDCLIHASRQAIRIMVDGLDPDEPARMMMPHWLDVLPGWRRGRAAVLARRKYRRTRRNLDRLTDQALARAYWDVRREFEARVETAIVTPPRGRR